MILGTTYRYDGITNLNFGQQGKYHPVVRTDHNIILGISKVNNQVGTLVNVQIALFDHDAPVEYWFNLTRDLNAITDDDGIGIIVDPTIFIALNCIEGIRIKPLGDETSFIMTVKEYPKSEIIRCVENDRYIIG